MGDETVVRIAQYRVVAWHGQVGNIAQLVDQLEEAYDQTDQAAFAEILEEVREEINLLAKYLPPHQLDMPF